MSAETHAVSITLGLATSGLLAYAGAVTQRRPVGPAERLALRAFAVWWYGAAVVILLPTLRTMLAVGGVVDPELHGLISQAGNFPLALALGGLAYYILYLLTGRAWLIWPVAVAYLAYCGYLVWYTSSLGDRTVELGEWQARLVGGNGASSSAYLVFGVLLAGPLLALVVAYGALAGRVKEPTQQYRLLMVTGGFAQLFIIILVAFALQWNNESWFPLSYELPALLLALLVVAAYRPPKFIRERLHVEPVPRDRPLTP